MIVVCQESLSDETRQKLSLSNKLKESEAEISRLQDQLDDEEDAKGALQKNLTQAQAQVGEQIDSHYSWPCIIALTSWEN